MSKDIGNLQDKSGNSLFPNVIDTVSNSNGTALKFADGTMICYGYKRGLSYTPDDMWNWCDRTSALTVILPVSFAIAPAISITSATFGVIGTNINAVYNDKFSFYGFQPKNCGATSMDVCYIAVGRWE